MTRINAKAKLKKDRFLLGSFVEIGAPGLVVLIDGDLPAQGEVFKLRRTSEQRHLGVINLTMPKSLVPKTLQRRRG